MRNPLTALRVRVLDSLADAAMLQDRIQDRIERRSDEKITPRLADIDRAIDTRVNEIITASINELRSSATDRAFQVSDDEWLTELINKGQTSIAYEIFSKMRRAHRAEIRGVAA